MKMALYARTTLRLLSSCAAVSLACFALQGCGSGMVTRTALVMGTVVEIRIPSSGYGGDQTARNGADSAIEELRRVESVFSVFDASSQISRINRLRKGEALKIDAEAMGLISRSLELCEKTGGAFDITVKPLVDLWAVARKTGRIPSDEEIADAKARTGYRAVLLDKGSSTIAFAEDGMAIDMGAVAKGYAVDRAVAALRKAGIKNAIVNCGGDMYCMGRRSRSRPWRLGVRHPRNARRLFMELDLEDKAIDTSGDYERFFISGSRRYSHIIDPRSGRPIGDGAVSASVIALDSVTADALATALCVLGRDGLKTVGGLKDVDAAVIFLDGDALVLETTGSFMERYNATTEI